MIHTLLNGWNFMRWLRLGLGLFIAIQAIQLHDTLSGFIAAFFLFQSLTNTGCCGVNACAAPPQNSKKATTEEISFEELK